MRNSLNLKSCVFQFFWDWKGSNGNKENQFLKYWSKYWVQRIQFSVYFYLKLKDVVLPLNRRFFQQYAIDRIHNIVSTLVNLVKLVVNDGIVSTLLNVVNTKVEVDDIDSILVNVVNFNVDLHNAVFMFIWRCPTSWSHINLTETLKQRRNIYC